MTRRFAFTILAVFTLTLFAPGAAIAHPGHEKKVMGTVTMTAPDHVMLKDPQGKDVTIQINKATKFVRVKKAMKASDMTVGMRVVVTAVTDEDDDTLIAERIDLGKAPATK